MKANKKEPRDRILKAAVLLFAQKGFSGVGVREIAKQAEVNIAMISYYFEGKVGILKAIMEEFFDRYTVIFEEVRNLHGSPDEQVRLIVRRLVEFVRRETDLALVAYNEMPLDVPEIAQLKAQKVTEIIAQLGWLIAKFELDPVQDAWRMGVIGPSLISMIVGNFRLRPVQQQVFQYTYDDDYYEKLIDMIGTLFLNGIHGIGGENRRKRSEK